MQRLEIPEKYDQAFELYVIISKRKDDWCQKRFDKIYSSFTVKEKVEFKRLQLNANR